MEDVIRETSFCKTGFAFRYLRLVSTAVGSPELHGKKEHVPLGFFTRVMKSLNEKGKHDERDDIACIDTLIWDNEGHEKEEDNELHYGVVDALGDDEHHHSGKGGNIVV